MAREIVSSPNTPTPSHHILEAARLAYPARLASPTPSRVKVLTPGPGDVVTVGHPVLIRWQTSCMPGLLLYCVQLSTDGGATYSRDISPLLDGKECHYLWIPTEDLVTPTARIRIVAINWGEATNDGSFMIRRSDRRHSVPTAPVLA